MYLMKKYFNINVLNLNSIGIILFPIALISGPFFSDLLCSYFSLYFIYYIFRHKKFELLNNIYFYILLTFYLYLNLNSLISFDILISLKSSVPFIRIILFIFFISFIIENNFKILKYLYIIFFVSILSLSIDSLSQFFFNKNIFGEENLHSRISSFFGDELIMGSYVSRLLPCIIGISYLINLKNIKNFNIILISLSFSLVVFSAERVAFFYIFLFLIIYLITHREIIFKFIIFVSFFIILNLFYNPIFVDRIFNHTFFQIKQSESILSYRHTLHLKTAYDMYSDKILFGHGLKSFRYKCSEEKYTKKILKKTQIDKEKFVSKYGEKSNGMKLSTKLQPIITYKDGCNTHPHNIYFEFLAEIGLIGFIFIVIFYLYFLYEFLIKFININFKKKKYNYNYCQLFILTGIVSTMLPMVPSGSFFNNWMLLISFFPVGLFYFVKKNLSKLNE